MHGQVAVRQSVAARQSADGLLTAPSLERRRLQCYLAQIVADVVGLMLAFAILGYLYLGPDRMGDALIS